MIVARGVHRDFLDETLCVHAGRNARPRELRSHEGDGRRDDKGEPVRYMIGQLIGGGRRDVRRAKEERTNLV